MNVHVRLQQALQLLSVEKRREGGCPQLLCRAGWGSVSLAAGQAGRRCRRVILAAREQEKVQEGSWAARDVAIVPLLPLASPPSFQP